MQNYDILFRDDFDCSAQSIGTLFRKIREEKDLSLDDIENTLRLPKKYISQLESDRHENIHQTYLKGYLRAYAKILDISDDKLYMMLNSLSAQEAGKPSKKYFGNREISSSDKLMQWITFSIVSILIFLVVLWWKSDNLLNNSLSSNDDLPGEARYTTMADNNFSTYK